MNVNTGELIRLQEQFVPEGFKEVPEDFRVYANYVLGDEDKAVVDMRDASNPLVHWAKSQQTPPSKSKKNKKHSRRKSTKASRKANR